MITNLAYKSEKRPNLREKVLDDDLCYYTWIALGTLNRISNKFVSEGVLSPFSGKAFTRQSFHIAAKRSALFKQYLDRRLDNPSLPAEPTKEEIKEAEIEMEKRLPAFVAKNKEDMIKIFPIINHASYGK